MSNSPNIIFAGHRAYVEHPKYGWDESKCRRPTYAELETALHELASHARTIEALRAALDRLVNAKALEGVRAIVAGWNGEGKPDGPYERHPNKLGATLPKTNCGAVYELDEALSAAARALKEHPNG